MSVRNLRRLRRDYEKWGPCFLLDGRRRISSVMRVPAVPLERLLRLYRERYLGFNVRHVHEICAREHGVRFSYSFVKRALQEARLVRRYRAGGRHRRRREPRACFGELLQLDGSEHRWLTLPSEEKQTLIAVIDGVTKQVLYAQPWPEETLQAVLDAVQEVRQGLPMAFHTDRAGWAGLHTEGGRSTRATQPRLGRSCVDWESSTSCPTRRRPGAHARARESRAMSPSASLASQNADSFLRFCALSLR